MRPTAKCRRSWHHRAALAGVAVVLASACADAPSVAGADGVRAVRAALDSSVAAWNRGDLEGHVAVYADSAVFRPEGPARGRVQARQNFARFFAEAATRPRLALDSLTVTGLGSDHVLATGQYVLNGGRVDVPRRGWFTEIWGRTPARWRILLDHSS